jgi:hypothetical protein
MRGNRFIPGTPKVLLKIIWTHEICPGRSNEAEAKTVISDERGDPVMGAMGYQLSLSH